MKVLFVHDHRFYVEGDKYYSTKFSPETWKTYIQEDNTVMVFARRTLKKCTQLSSDDPRVEYHLTSIFTNPLSAILRYKKLKEEIKDAVSVADCVVVRMPSITGIIAASIAKKQGKRLLAEVVGDAFDAYKYYGNLSGRIFAPIFKFLNKRAIKNMDAVLYVTKEYLQNLYPTNGITSGCSDALLDAVPETVLQMRLDKIAEAKTSIKCGEVGNISMPYKGYEVMLQAMSILSRDGIMIEFHVVGGGDPTQFYDMANKYGVRDYVHYDGMMNHSEINNFYDSIDIYVHPSFTEGLPRVVAEAISRGCPCLVSKAGGTPELVNSRYTHNIKDYKKLADDLKLLIADKELCKNVAIENYNNAKLYYADNLKSIRMDFYKRFFQL